MCLIHRFTIYCTNMLQYMCFGPFYTLRPLKYKKKKIFKQNGSQLLLKSHPLRVTLCRKTAIWA